MYLFVKENVDLVDKAAADVGGENVPGGDEQLLADGGRLLGAVEQELDHVLGNDRDVRLKALRVVAQDVGQERQRLDLGRDKVGVRLALQLLGRRRRLQRQGVDDQRHKDRNVGLETGDRKAGNVGEGRG